MSDRARIRINLAQREFEVEGSEAFVRSFTTQFDSLFERLDEQGEVPEPSTGMAAGAAARPNGVRAEPFGAYIQRLPSSATEVDHMLAAGFFIQVQSQDDAFATAEASRALLEHGVKLGNPSQCVKQSLIAKRVFLVNKGRYRVSQTGRAHLRQLLGPIIEA